MDWSLSPTFRYVFLGYALFDEETSHSLFKDMPEGDIDPKISRSLSVGFLHDHLLVIFINEYHFENRL